VNHLENLIMGTQKKIQRLTADVESLQRLMETLAGNFTVLAESLTHHKDQIASLQASDLVMVESMKTVTENLNINPAPLNTVDLPGYQ
jgi:chromosome segregation ATPase